jgi:hypothetical protein
MFAKFTTLVKQCFHLRIYFWLHTTTKSWDSSASIVSDYRLDEWDSGPGKDKGLLI